MSSTWRFTVCVCTTLLALISTCNRFGAAQPSIGTHYDGQVASLLAKNGAFTAHDRVCVPKMGFSAFQSVLAKVQSHDACTSTQRIVVRRRLSTARKMGAKVIAATR